MALTYRPFAEAPNVEELTQDLETPNLNRPNPLRMGRSLVVPIAGVVLIAWGLTRSGSLRRVLLSAGSAIFAMWWRRI
jgi:hypothetical protein